MQRPMRLPVLSARLEAVASLVKPCERLFDIGTDHAFLPIELVRRGIARTAVASDIRSGPIAVAERNIQRAGLSDRIQTAVTFGLEGHAVGPDDAVVLSGLGGLEMIDILEKQLKPCGQVILQPQKSAMELRNWLVMNHYQIDEEELVLDRGRVYVVIRAVPSSTAVAEPGHTPALTLSETVIGPVLMHRRPPLFERYLLQVASHLKVASRRMPELNSVLQTIESMLASCSSQSVPSGGAPP